MQNKPKRYKDTLTLEERLAESQKIARHYSDRVPIIIEKGSNSKLPDLEMNKFLFMNHFKVFQLNTLLRSQMNLDKAEAVYLFVNNKVVLRGGMRVDIFFNRYDDQRRSSTILRP